MIFPERLVSEWIRLFIFLIFRELFQALPWKFDSVVLQEAGIGSFCSKNTIPNNNKDKTALFVYEWKVEVRMYRPV